MGTRLTELVERFGGRLEGDPDIEVTRIAPLDRDNWPTITFDIVNLNKARREGYFQFPNAQFTSYDPGRTFQLGIRGKF